MNFFFQVYNNGENSRAYTYVDDVVEGVCRVLFGESNINQPKAAVYNIGTEKTITTKRLIELIEGEIGSNFTFFDVNTKLFFQEKEQKLFTKNNRRVT